MPKFLTAEGFAKAATFLTTQARPLDHARYDFHFEGGAAENVLTELAAYQNADGGFGHALEPDLHLPGSSVIATTVALQIAREVDTAADHPLVERACHYLRDTYDAQNAVWPIIPPNVDDAPHAPWWVYRGNVTDWLINPRAEIAGYICDYAKHFPREMCKTVTDAVVAHLMTLDSIEMHELLCVLRFAESAALPKGTRARIDNKLTALVRATVEHDPAQWNGYGLQPLDVAPTPASPFAELFGPLIEQNLAVLAAQQNTDGSWSPPWTWGDLYPDAWPQAQRDWMGVLTIKNLRILRAYDAGE